MLEKMQWGQWNSALAGVGQAENMPRLLWALRLVIVLLALLAGIYAVVHFVLLVGSDRAAGPAGATTAVAAGVNPAADLNAETVKGWGWYSDPQAGSIGNGAGAGAAANENVKKTRLQMRLEGIVKSDEEKESVAIIAINNQAKQYKTGARLPVAPGVFLRTIDVDRIILDNNGSLEELLLFSKNMAEQRRTTVEEPEDSGVLDRSSDEAVTEMMGRYRDRIQSNPGSINELIKFSAHTQNGKLAGFKVGAANNQQDFERLGLEDGDVITHVNGVELSDYRKALNLYKEMGSLSEVRVQLMRGDQPQELIFRLPDEG